MSSVVSSKDVKSTTASKVTKLKSDEKRLVRASSIEKIKRFNSMICSQQYLILSALLGMLKTSHPSLQFSADKTLVYFEAVFCKVYLAYLLDMAKKVTRHIRQSFSELPEAILRCYRLFRRHLESTLALTCAVYTAMGLVLVQMFVCSYYMHLVMLPVGFIFLLSCMFVMQYLNYKTMFFFMRSNDKHK